jgi:hypothetical protein
MPHSGGDDAKTAGSVHFKELELLAMGEFKDTVEVSCGGVIVSAKQSTGALAQCDLANQFLRRHLLSEAGRFG